MRALGREGGGWEEEWEEEEEEEEAEEEEAEEEEGVDSSRFLWEVKGRQEVVNAEAGEGEEAGAAEGEGGMCQREKRHSASGECLRVAGGGVGEGRRERQRTLVGSRVKKVDARGLDFQAERGV